ncbi:MAG: 50S ribosomal protein L25/general stress protein Ctc [Alphaproteobacteria bacterium]|nr:50S ribosomal protein L25/general stress protein Ctc [Alphaproteobacteria bacterium]
MTEIATMEAQARDRSGKGAARSTRNAGLVPAVIYGDQKPTKLIAIDPRALTRALRSGGFYIRQYNVKVDGEDHRVMARDVQFHPVTDVPLHVDFLRVTGRTKVTVEIPVVFANEEESPGLTRGGVLNVVRYTIEVNTTVDNIPEEFRFDLTGLDIGDSVHISMVEMPAGVEPTIADRDFTVATVAAPTVVAEEAAAEAAEAEEEELEGVEPGEEVEGEGEETEGEEEKPESE